MISKIKHGIAYSVRGEADAQIVAEFACEIDILPIEDELAVFEKAFLEQSER